MPSREENEREFAEAREVIIAAAAMHDKPLPPSTFFHAAWEKGYWAKRKGFMRVSPYYEDELRSPYWLAGYDGIPFSPPMLVKPIEEVNATD